MNTLLPAWVLLANLALMLAGWLVSRRLRNAGIADLLWPISLCASAVYFGATANGSSTAKILVVVMGGVWGTRRFLHLLDRILTEHEDARYRHLRATHPNPETYFFVIFLRRAITATVFSLSFLVAANNPQAGFTPWTLLAAATYFCALAGETRADRQLALFRANPRHLGHVCRRGLWRYSRHPNYLFSALHWSSYTLLAICMPWPQWSLTLIAPLLTILGWPAAIRANEAQAIRTRGEDYRQYKAATPVLLPWLPRGWPNDQPDSSSWQTPAPPSHLGRRAVKRMAADVLVQHRPEPAPESGPSAEP